MHGQQTTAGSGFPRVAARRGSRSDSESDWQHIARSIANAVRQRTGYAIRQLSVKVSRDGVVISGQCDSFYNKQLAQHAAMRTAGDNPLTNQIEVD